MTTASSQLCTVSQGSCSKGSECMQLNIYFRKKAKTERTHKIQKKERDREGGGRGWQKRGWSLVKGRWHVIQLGAQSFAIAFRMTTGRRFAKTGEVYNCVSYSTYMIFTRDHRETAAAAAAAAAVAVAAAAAAAACGYSGFACQTCSTADSRYRSRRSPLIRNSWSTQWILLKARQVWKCWFSCKI